MHDQRCEEIDRLIEDAGRCFDPVTGRFESLAGDDEETDTDLEATSFLATLGITAEECAAYVARKLRDYDAAFRDA
ncbi:MAG: hypothetical protein ACKOZU_01380 [Planctomycetaceae bacterium]